MSTFLANNNAGTTLGSNLTNVATTMTVAVGTGALFPSPNPALGQYFVMTLFAAANVATGTPNEIVWVTAVVGDTMTIVRAQEGTTALSFITGDYAQNLWTKGQALSLVQASQLQIQAGDYGIDTGTANAMSIVLSTIPSSLASLTGAPIRVQKGAAANTGPTTIVVNGFGPTPVVYPGGAAMISGVLPANGMMTLGYDGTVFELQSLPGIVAVSGTAGGDLTGTYPNPTINNNVVTNAKLAQMTTDTVKANITGGTANPTDVSFTSLLTALGFTYSVTGSGVAIYLGPFIVQMGQTTAISQDTGAYAITLPVTFPTAVFTGSAQATLAPTTFNTSTDYGATVIGNPSTSTITVSVGAYQGQPTGTAFPVNWMVWGR